MRARGFLSGLLAAGALAALGAAAVVTLGLFDTSARKGHWPGVAALLHFAFERSVVRHAIPPDEIPELTEAMARLGARHYDAACRTCHGTPHEPAGATVRAMLPRPPPILEAVEGWSAGELGWIVREGVKMTGMPGWPAARDDEIWPVVAFLVRLPGLAPERRAALVAPVLAEGPPDLGYCAGCHGADGRSGNPHVPRLDIQQADYLETALLAYRAGRRQSGFMSHAASLVPAEALPALARHYGGQPAGPAEPQPPADPALLAEGRALALARPADPKVPACQSCHGPRAEERRADVPVLSGQYRPYLRAQLKLWRDGIRGGGPRAALMTEAAARLDDRQIEALAAFYSSLDPGDI